MLLCKESAELSPEILKMRINTYQNRLSQGQDLWTGKPLHPFLVRELENMAKQREHYKEKDGDKTSDCDNEGVGA